MSCRSSSDSVRISQLNITENSSKGGLSKIVYYLSLKKFQDRNLRTAMVVLHHQILWFLLSVLPSQFMISKFHHPVGQNNYQSSSHHICVLGSQKVVSYILPQLQWVSTSALGYQGLLPLPQWLNTFVPQRIKVYFSLLFSRFSLRQIPCLRSFS